MIIKLKQDGSRDTTFGANLDMSTGFAGGSTIASIALDTSEGVYVASNTNRYLGVTYKGITKIGLDGSSLTLVS